MQTTDNFRQSWKGSCLFSESLTRMERQNMNNTLLKTVLSRLQFGHNRGVDVIKLTNITKMGKHTILKSKFVNGFLDVSLFS